MTCTSYDAELAELRRHAQLAQARLDRFVATLGHRTLPWSQRRRLGSIRTRIAALVKALAVSLLLTGCATGPELPPERFTAAPVPAQCDAACTTPCTPPSSGWPQWQGDPEAPETWDRWPTDVGVPLRELSETCDTARAACVQCLHRLERAGLICGVGRPCGGVE